jgi:hypothetical protein
MRRMEMNPIDVQKQLKGVDYQASGDDLVSAAKENGADDELVRQLEGLGSQEFESPAEVMKALG